MKILKNGSIALGFIACAYLVAFEPAATEPVSLHEWPKLLALGVCLLAVLWLYDKYISPQISRCTAKLRAEASAYDMETLRLKNK